MRYFVSGGAPLSPALSYSFLGAGINILQGYGMTETCVVCANRPGDNCVGSIGKAFAGIDVAIAEDGEILVRGPNVMRGYYGHPEATDAVMNDGWFATGDVGYKDDAGHIFITDRKKDLFKLSNGKYIAPQQLESLLKQSEYVNQVIVLGSSRKYPAALIVPDWEDLKSALRAAGENVSGSHAEISSLPAAIKLVQKDVTAITAHLAVQANALGQGPVVLADTDPQGSLAQWWRARNDDTLALATLKLEDIVANPAALRNRGAALAIIDTPPALTASIEEVIAIADLVIIPARPSPHDLRAVGVTVEMTRRAGKQFLFVVNGAAPRANITAEAVAALSEHGRVAPVILYQRTDYAASMIDGRTVMETAASGRSAQEIADLWSYVYAQISVRQAA